MTSTFQLLCPHCGTSHVAFELVQESWLPHSSRWQACARCNRCSGFVVLEFEEGPDEDDSPISPSGWNPTEFHIEKMHPASDAEIPLYLPEDVKRFYSQGVDNAPTNPDAAGIMFRKTLEAVLRDKCATATGGLFKRIDHAAEVGILTADLARYAHTIRLEGNEAAHGTYDKADAQRLHSLVKLVLQYVYTLPGMQSQIDTDAHEAAKNDVAT